MSIYGRIVLAVFYYSCTIIKQCAETEGGYSEESGWQNNKQIDYAACNILRNIQIYTLKCTALKIGLSVMVNHGASLHE